MQIRNISCLKDLLHGAGIDYLGHDLSDVWRVPTSRPCTPSRKKLENNTSFQSATPSPPLASTATADDTLPPPLPTPPIAVETLITYSDHPGGKKYSWYVRRNNQASRPRTAVGVRSWEKHEGKIIRKRFLWAVCLLPPSSTSKSSSHGACTTLHRRSTDPDPDTCHRPCYRHRHRLQQSQQKPSEANKEKSSG